MTKLYAGNIVEVHDGGNGPIDPGFGGGPRPPHVGGGPLPPPLPGVWPPLTPERPSHELPEGSPLPPGMIWPGAGRPDNALPGTPAAPDNTLPPTPSSKHIVLVWISGGIGWHYVVIDPSLKPGTPLPPAPTPK